MSILEKPYNPIFSQNPVSHKKYKAKHSALISTQISKSKKHAKKPHRNSELYSITLIHQNRNWLRNKLVRLAYYLSYHSPDFIILSEHGADEENLDNTRVEGYSLIGGVTRKTT
uniref:Uncharacterized protein n=1 Tax=Homalodisca liturata TaxID=320908 RepID=A0A1B6K7T0_9HEMI